MDYISKYRQYGMKGFIVRSIRSVLRKIGVDYESYHYFAAEVDKNRLLEILNAPPVPDVKLLAYDDFLLGDRTVFDDEKLSLIKKRFDNPHYKAYGIKDTDNGNLLYSCWINDEELLTSSSRIKCMLEKNECLLLDAYCSPQVRGKGFHTKMNAYRCMKAIEMGKPKCIVIVLKGNIPAQKVQQKCGLKIVFDYYVLNVFGKTYTDFYKKKEKYDC